MVSNAILFCAYRLLMGKKEGHIIELNALEIGHYDYRFELDNTYFSTIEKTELLGGKVEVNAQLDLRADDYDLSLTIYGKVQVTCDRCLDPVDIEVDNTEDMAPLLGEVEAIDLDWLAYEQIIVNLPLVHCHPEGGCNPEMAALLQNHLCSTPEEPDAI